VDEGHWFIFNSQKHILSETPFWLSGYPSNGSVLYSKVQVETQVKLFSWVFNIIRNSWSFVTIIRAIMLVWVKKCIDWLYLDLSRDTLSRTEIKLWSYRNVLWRIEDWICQSKLWSYRNEDTHTVSDANSYRICIRYECAKAFGVSE
jgi:hypothetical protein